MGCVLRLCRKIKNERTSLMAVSAAAVSLCCNVAQKSTSIPFCTRAATGESQMEKTRAHLYPALTTSLAK